MWAVTTRVNNPCVNLFYSLSYNRVYPCWPACCWLCDSAALGHHHHHHPSHCCCCCHGHDPRRSDGVFSAATGEFLNVYVLLFPSNQGFPSCSLFYFSYHQVTILGTGWPPWCWDLQAESRGVDCLVFGRCFHEFLLLKKWFLSTVLL